MSVTATPSNPAKMVSLSKSVREMSIDGDEPPQSFIFGDDPIDTSPPLASIPIIDISLFSPSSLKSFTQEKQSELEKLRSALSSWGCFQAVGHGMSNQFLDKSREITKEFFGLPMEEKQKCARAAAGSEGYGTDRVVSEKQLRDWTDRLYLRVYPENQRNLKNWPEKPQDFRATVEEYVMNINSLIGILFKAMAESLKLEENSFLKQFGDKALIFGRFMLYPTCTRPDQVFGLKAHTDGSAVTVLLQDKEVQGLQVLYEDKWFGVPIIPHALFVNLGDQIQIMSNVVFKSPVHRVVTNRERDRISIALFKGTELEKEIEPDDQLVDENRPRLYKKVKNYGALHYECSQKMLVALDTVRI